MDANQQHRLKTVTQVESMIDNLGLEHDFALIVLDNILKSYLMKGGTYHHTLTMTNSKDRPREIVVKLYDNPSQPDLVKIQAKTTSCTDQSSSGNGNFCKPK